MFRVFSPGAVAAVAAPCRCNPRRLIAWSMSGIDCSAEIGISTPRLCKARAIMEIELSSWRAPAHSNGTDA